MPTPEIKKLAKQSNEPVSEIENTWEKLLKEVQKFQNNKVNNKYAYAVGTLEKIYGKKK